MARYIDADALIKDFMKSTPYGCGTVGIKFVDDLIKAQPTAYDVDAVVAELQNGQMWKEFMIYDLTHREREIIGKAIEIVKNLASEHNNGWISVEDRLPEDNQCPVLACTRNDVMYTAVYDAVYDKWYDDNFEREIFITDWQPLPQAPRKGE